jgi:hypothetical protein
MMTTSHAAMSPDRALGVKLNRYFGRQVCRRIESLVFKNGLGL